MEQRESFVFYRSFFEALQGCPDEIRLAVYEEMMQYALYPDYTPKLDGVGKALFTLIRPQIDANVKKRENGQKGAEYGKMGAEYGKMGGRPRKPQEPPQNPPQKPQEPPKNPRNVNVNDNDNNRETNVSQKTIKTKKRENLENYEKPSKEENDRFIGLLKRYNAILAEMDSNINRVVMLTPYRVERLRRLVLDFSDEQIERGFRQAAASSYLNGRTKERERPADFDWIIDYNNFVKIYEGGL